MVNVKDNKIAKKTVSENGPDGNAGQPGNPQAGGVYGQNAVRKVTRSERSERRGGLAGVFGGRRTFVDYSTETYMEWNYARGPSGHQHYNFNYANRLQPSLKEINLKTILSSYSSAIERSFESLKSYSIWVSSDFLNGIKNRINSFGVI